MWRTLSSWGLLALGAAIGCDEGEVPPCEEQDVPTCSSSLVVQRSNDSSSFVFNLEGGGLDLRIECPTPADEEARQDEITWFCGAGRVTLEQPGEWPETLRVGFGGSAPSDVSPVYTQGLDRCGNLCNDGTITLD